MNPRDMLPHQLMQRLADFFEAEQIPYRVVGSLASTVYGEPRFTNDVDMVADIPLSKSGLFCQRFCLPEYIVTEAAVRDAIARRFQFNVLHPASGLKADIILPPHSEFTQAEAQRVRRLRAEGEYDAWFASPEDVVLNKLVYYQLSGGVSDKHLRDIASMRKMLGDKLDRDYIAAWAGKLGVLNEWSIAQARDAS